MNELLDIAPKEGLLEVLSGKSDWRSVIGLDELSGAHVIPTAEGEFSPRDMFGTTAMEDLMHELSSIYDLIILDCAPVLAVAETRIVVTHADTVILTCHWGKTNAKAVSSAIHQLSNTTTNIMGIALNLVDPKAPGKSSYYDSLYYGKSKGYYQES